MPPGPCQCTVLVVRASEPVSRRLEAAVESAEPQRLTTRSLFTLLRGVTDVGFQAFQSGGRRTGVCAWVTCICMCAQLLMGWRGQQQCRFLDLERRHFSKILSACFVKAVGIA